MSNVSFVKLTDEQKTLAKKVLERINVEKSFNLDTAEVAFLIDSDCKFTSCLLKSTAGKKSGLTVGIAKRATYCDMADDYDEEVGNAIAFSRAVKNKVIPLIRSSVVL